MPLLGLNPRTQHLFLLFAFVACTSAERRTDHFDVPTELIGNDSVTVDLRAFDPSTFTRTPAPFRCGTFDLTAEQQAQMDSVAAVVRAGGGVMCYDQGILLEAR